MTNRRSTAPDALRGDILAMGCDAFVSIADGRLAESVAERQQLVVDTVRSLLVDGLVEVGVIPSPDNPGFKTWPGTVDEVMTRFIDRFVAHYDDRRGGEYA